MIKHDKLGKQGEKTEWIWVKNRTLPENQETTSIQYDEKIRLTRGII